MADRRPSPKHRFSRRRDSMPLKINLGLARKVGEPNYSSRGASIHIEMEFDGELANQPGKLQARIRQLFALVRSSLAEELNGHKDAGNANGNGNANANGNGNGHSAENGQ